MGSRLWPDDDTKISGARSGRSLLFSRCAAYTGIDSISQQVGTRESRSKVVDLDPQSKKPFTSKLLPGFLSACLSPEAARQSEGERRVSQFSLPPDLENSCNKIQAKITSVTFVWSKLALGIWTEVEDWCVRELWKVKKRALLWSACDRNVKMSEWLKKRLCSVSSRCHRAWRPRACGSGFFLSSANVRSSW